MLGCFKNKEPSGSGEQGSSDEELLVNNDPKLWSRDLTHFAGTLSWAVARPKEDVMLGSQIEIASNALFIGIFDGFEGSEASKFLLDKFFDRLVSVAINHGRLDTRTITDTFTAVDSEFLNSIEDEAIRDPQVAVVGSSCLMFLIWKRKVILATVGDSYGLMGRKGYYQSEQINFPHYLDNSVLRHKFLRDHANHQPDDILVKRDDDWCLKGGTKLYKAMGVGYLKRSTIVAPTEFQEKYQFSGPITENVLSHIPNITHKEEDIERVEHDRFVILGSQGFWKQFNNDQAAAFVRNRRRTGIARMLVEEAQRREKSSNTTGEEASSEICVAVVFLDTKRIGKKQDINLQCTSYRGFGETADSKFSDLQHLSD